MAHIPYFTFNNGEKIPAIGMGYASRIGIAQTLINSLDAGWEPQAKVNAPIVCALTR